MMILELQNAILEMIAKGEPLATTLSALCSKVEAAIPGIAATVLKSDGVRLSTLAAPSLPISYSAAVDGLKIGPYAGSCGTATFLGAPVVVTDIETNPIWADYAALALPLGLKACWSSPINAAIALSVPLPSTTGRAVDRANLSRRLWMRACISARSQSSVRNGWRSVSV